ncbi:MAG: heme ABC exporter ATP-binding protein CcmA [Sneathiella sp.]|nr:heme ABC exporter ATP-binding protein CcmA [Sneathiella sp.]
MSLNARHLSCIRQDRLIFKNISFSLNSGEVLWIKGKNGAGKSSLLRIIAGLLKPIQGEILWQGENVKDDPDIFQNQFRYIAHQDALKPALTGTENLRFWSQYFGTDNVPAALKEFELERIADVPTGIMSAGQKKRTNLARLIACPAPLWILDEPVSSLDTHYIALFRNQLVRHVKNGGMAVLATHQDLELDFIQMLDLDAERGKS